MSGCLLHVAQSILFVCDRVVGSYPIWSAEKSSAISTDAIAGPVRRAAEMPGGSDAMPTVRKSDYGSNRSLLLLQRISLDVRDREAESPPDACGRNVAVQLSLAEGSCLGLRNAPVTCLQRRVCGLVSIHIVS